MMPLYMSLCFKRDDLLPSGSFLPVPRNKKITIIFSKLNPPYLVLKKWEMPMFMLEVISSVAISLCKYPKRYKNSLNCMY